MVLTLFVYLLFLGGLVLSFVRVCTAPHEGSVKDDALLPPESQQAPATTVPARKTVYAVAGGMLLGTVCSWGFDRLVLPMAANMDIWVRSLGHQLCLFPLSLSSTAGLAVAISLLISVKRHLPFYILETSASGVGPLLVLFSCSRLIHLLVPDKAGVHSVDVDPAGFQLLPPFLIFLCLTGTLMLVTFRAASVNPGDVFSFGLRGRRVAVLTLVLGFTGLVHLLVRTAEDGGGLIDGGLELPMLVLYLAFVASLAAVLWGISAWPVRAPSQATIDTVCGVVVKE